MHNKITIIDMIISIINRLFLVMTIYVKVVFLKLTNILLRVFGCTRVYDISNKKDITFFYHLLKYTSKYNVPFVVDFTYPKLGVCTFNNGRYVRYICYNERLSKIENRKFKICSNGYDSVKKIELLYRDNEKEIKTDMTDSKNNFYDIDFFTDPYDMIRFYKLCTGDHLIESYMNIDQNYSTKSILFTREDFDDSLLEYVKTFEEIYPPVHIGNAHYDM
jgi:hypothetical protein